MRVIDILKDEHRVIEQVLACLDRLAERFEAGQALDRATAWQILDFFRYFADGGHHGKEEEHLFPLLESHGLLCVGESAAVLRDEHKKGREHIDAMTLALVRGSGLDFVAGSRKYSRLTREHIRKEEAGLFATAERKLSRAECETLLRGYTEVEKEEMGVGTHADYVRLAHLLVDRLGVSEIEDECETISVCDRCVAT